MILEKCLETLKTRDRVLCKCDNCEKEFTRLLKNIYQSRKERNSSKDYCKKCSCILSINKKPQCSKQYWSSIEIKQKHSESIKNSKKYRDSIKIRNNSLEKNGMFGKKHSIESRKKMSLSRTGKKQSIETINKRKKTISEKPKKISINSQVKSFLHRELNWYFKIYQRDKFKCTQCGSNKKIDAHHIKPISIIIKEKLKDNLFENELDKLTFLKEDKDIIDKDLKNGITLCRECHKKIHYNWGSHNAKSRESDKNLL